MNPMKAILTTLEASEKYQLSARYVRVLLAEERIKGRQAKISKSRFIWLIDEPSLKKYLKQDHPVGRPKKTT